MGKKKNKSTTHTNKYASFGNSTVKKADMYSKSTNYKEHMERFEAKKSEKKDLSKTRYWED